MEENLVDSFYQTIMDATDPGKDLARFLWACLSKEPASSDIAILRKLVKIYGRRVVFYSILDMLDVSTLNVDKYYGLLTYFIKRKIEEKYEARSNYKDLSSMVDTLKTEIGRSTVDIEKLRGLLNDEGIV